MPWQVYNSAGQLLQATDLVDGTVTASKLDTNAVTNAKVADDAIGVVELSATGTASSSTFLRGDNAWAAPGGGPSQATQSDIEAETNEDTYVPPDLVKFHKGVAKAWINMEMIGTQSIQDSYNVSGIADNNVGETTVSFTVAMSSAHYAIVHSVNLDHGRHNHSAEQVAGSFEFAATNSSHALTDADDIGIVVFAAGLA